MPHRERHRTAHIGWLRASVLGANDGLISTASLVIGVAASGTGRSAILIAGVAGVVAGSMSMAAGEYVSVSSQADAERADLAREAEELATQPEAERDELAGIYRARGLSAELARQVAEELTRGDALAAHARDELGITETGAARPLQAAGASALSFAVGALLPLVVAAAAPMSGLAATVSVVSVIALAALGAIGARAGRASTGRAALRVVFWGAAAMGITAGVGTLFHVAV